MKRQHFLPVAVLVAISIMPALGQAIAEESKPFPGTTCSIGNETLAYDPAAGQYALSSRVGCTSPYPSIGLKLTLFQVQAPVSIIPVLTVRNECAGCTEVVASATKPHLFDGLYQLHGTGTVLASSGAKLTDSHGSCYLVQGYQVTTLLKGCGA